MPADVKACVKSFTVDGATTGSNVVSGIVDANGAAFTPKLAIIFGNANGFIDTSLQVVFDSLAVDDAVTPKGTSYGWFWFDAVTWSGHGTSYAASLLSNIFRFSPAFRFVGKFDSFASGSFTYSVSTNTLDLTLAFSVLLLGGDDLKYSIGQMESAIGVHTLTGLDYQPKGAICFNQIASGFSGTSQSIINIGFCDTELNQYANCAVVDELDSPALANRYQAADVVCVTVNPTTEVKQDLAKINAWTADGFTYEILAGASGIPTNVTYILLGVDDPSATIKVGSFLQSTINGSQQVSIPNNTPVFIMMASVGGVSSETIEPDCAWSLGAFDGTRSRSTYNACLKGATPAGDGGAVYGSDNLLFFATPDGQISSDALVTGKLEGASFDSNGFNGEWTEVDGIEREIFYITLGIPAAINAKSGIYELVPLKRHDTLYLTHDPVTTVNVKIP